MARTANTGFSYFKSMIGQGEMPIPTQIRIANSTALRVGDLVRVNTSGFVVTAGAGAPVAGVLTGFVDENGINPWSLAYPLGNPGCTLTGDDTLTTSSSNQTSAHYINAEVVLSVAGESLWLNKADGALTQTNLFQFFDVDANSRQVVTGGASDANGQVQLIALDPEATGGATADSTKGLFRIAENQFGLGIDSATAKNAA